MTRSVGEGFRELDARIHYYPKYGSRQNFGDYLPELIGKRLLTVPKIDVDVFRLIGSVIDEERVRRNLRTVNGVVSGQIAFWGCGARSASPLGAEVRGHCRFFGVRGPRTRDALGLPGDTVLGDPGLLAPLFHLPRTVAEVAGRTICIPHILDPRPPAELLAMAGTDLLVSPEIDASEAALCGILDTIASADFVLTASLHGAIVALAYDRPFAFWDNGFVDTPFKWDDFAGSVNMPARFVANLAEGRAAYAEHAAAIRPPPLAPLLDICPFQVRPSMLARALAYDGHADAEALRRAADALAALPGERPDAIETLQAMSRRTRGERGRLSLRIAGFAGRKLRALKATARRAPDFRA